MPIVNYPYIPETITVHLGPPNSPAENVTVPFIDYVKNVASSEIFPTWPESALRANIYVIITYALNRIYTEWYRSRGFDFDITGSTQFDQAFVKDREIFGNISDIVDEIFDSYVVRRGSIEPFFTQFCNGTTVKCKGLSQWGTVDLANQGLTPYEILQYYYGDDIDIVTNVPVAGIEESFPGYPLRLGDSENNVKIIQTELNRIADNYPAIPKISPVNGVFGVSTENAVKKFQEIFDLPVTGVVDKATWYLIKRYYTAVKKLTELISEGISYEEAEVPYTEEVSLGMSGLPVTVIQYYLSIIGYFNPALDMPPVDGYFGESTLDAVKTFQQYYGLPVTGVVAEQTWLKLNEVYRDILGGLPEGYEGSTYAKLYPGYVLSEGMRGQDVTDLQTYLSFIGKYYRDLPQIPVTGYFGPQTRDAVYTFQRLFGLPISGVVSPVTWREIARQYNFLKTTEASG
ncbi:MAG: peptidoglycan-binding protein [Oscillospiraceae bacterium]|nr:peptidoglycan-binding protein [Oscillospiraceae bacterium]